jgi:hypothetical protein
LFSNHYPGAYSQEERLLLASYFSSLSQPFQLEGGIDTADTLCHAGSRIICVDFTSGAIWPCISVQTPVLGNIYEDALSLMEIPISCPKAGMACNCDIHYQQDIVIGAEDGENFERVKAGYLAPIPLSEQRRQLKDRGLKFSAAPKGIGDVADDQTLIYSKSQVKQQFLKNFAKALVNIQASAQNDPVGAGAVPQKATKQGTTQRRSIRSKLMALWGH